MIFAAAGFIESWKICVYLLVAESHEDNLCYNGGLLTDNDEEADEAFYLDREGKRRREEFYYVWIILLDFSFFSGFHALLISQLVYLCYTF